MKASAAIILLMLISSGLSHAQWQSGTHIYNTNSGNVGIGTTSPSYKLDVVGDMGFSGTAYFFNSPFYHYNTSTGKYMGFQTQSSGGHIWMTDLSTPIILQSLGGNVGIGTHIPQKRLEVTTPVNDYISIGQTFNAGQWSGFHFGYKQNGNALYRKSAIVFERTDVNAARGKIHFLNNDADSGASATLSDAKMTIDYTGNVGIGTTTPGTYRLNVNGRIRANEVVVNTTGADFVFEDDYTLLPLHELETFVKTHKHLPDIPPAAKMQQDGVGISELQTKLLQKIEELSLYMIDLKKENEELKRRVSAIEKID